ncbi:MAG: hypothetical protein JWO18_2774 [Microbacteriaceae bacterium]|jgi:hypothetical protein|nr:hypothetical protein [Microbacteriaceae bacterium]
MPGYSQSSQARKLGLTPGMRISILDAPAHWSLDDPPELEVVGEDVPADIVLVFLREAASVDERLLALGRRIHPAGALWVAWPRKAAGHVSDVTENLIRDSVLPHGLVDVKVAAIDEDWSGLKVVWRLSSRGGR